MRTDDGKALKDYSNILVAKSLSRCVVFTFIILFEKYLHYGSAAAVSTAFKVEHRGSVCKKDQISWGSEYRYSEVWTGSKAMYQKNNKSQSVNIYLVNNFGKHLDAYKTNADGSASNESFTLTYNNRIYMMESGIHDPITIWQFNWGSNGSYYEFFCTIDVTEVPTDD